jgi:hypothetical protein
VQRATRANDVRVEPGEHGEFSILVSWDHKGQAGSYLKAYTRQAVFGPSYSLAPEAWSVQRKACEYARELMRDVLQRRGIL